MKAKIKSSGEIIEVERITNRTYGRIDGVAELYRKDMLDFNLDPPHPEATISGWVARTKRRELIFSDKPPCGKSNVIWHYREGTDVRNLSDLKLFPNNIFPDLTWESDPIEVEITIKPKKQ